MTRITLYFQSMCIYSIIYMTEMDGEDSDIRLAAIQGLASCVPSLMEQDSL